MRFPHPLLLVLLLTLGLVVAACGTGTEKSTAGAARSADGAAVGAIDAPANAAPVGSVIVLGDSIMAWNVESGQSIPDVIGETLGVPVSNAAVGGAFATDVPEQYADAGGDHDWVVFDGGGNDLNDRCGCGDCAAVADSLVTTDGGAGVLADFTEALVADGKSVAVVGYYEIPETAHFGYDRCVDELTGHNQRLRALAERFDSVIFVDPGQVVSGTDRAAFDDDDVHPSAAGSRIVGEQIAAAITAAG